MPVTEERLYSPRKLDRWFAVSSVVMTVSIVWMVYVDYDRPWRHVQGDYFIAQASLAHPEYLTSLRPERLEGP